MNRKLISIPGGRKLGVLQGIEEPGDWFGEWDSLRKLLDLRDVPKQLAGDLLADPKDLDALGVHCLLLPGGAAAYEIRALAKELKKGLGAKDHALELAIALAIDAWRAPEEKAEP